MGRKELDSCEPIQGSLSGNEEVVWAGWRRVRLGECGWCDSYCSSG